MKKLLGCLMALAMALALCAGTAEEAADAQVRGRIGDDGAYVLTAQPDPGKPGTWVAQVSDPGGSVVELASSGTEDGVFTARFEPVGDGKGNIQLSHIDEDGPETCDRILGFTLLVEGGKVKEVTGGFEIASPPEDELDPHFSGEWLEMDTQFTAASVTKNAGSGWAVEITSPVSHGAWVFRGNVRYDCFYDAFVCRDGVKYDILPDGTLEAQPGKNSWGTLTFTGPEENLRLAWSGLEDPETGEVIFERAPGLPAYMYTGTDPVEGAVAEALACDSRAAAYLTEPGSVTIPCPLIHRAEMTDDTHAKVYGSFWILNYVRRGTVLFNISGGEYPGVMTLEKTEDAWKMTSLETAGDGEDYAADIMRFANGDAALAMQYFGGADLMAEANRAVRTRLIRDYAEANSLPVNAYQDYGWDPVPLE